MVKHVGEDLSPDYSLVSDVFCQRDGLDHSPTLNKILEVITPCHSLFWLVLQFGDWLPYDVGEQVNQSSSWLHLRPISWEWEPVLSDFQKRDTQTPDIGSDGITLSRDPLWCHVVTRSNKRIRVAFRSEFARHAEITQLDLPVAAEQNIRGLDISVDNAVLVEVC